MLTEGDYATVSADPQVREVYMGTDGSGERGAANDNEQTEAAQ
ncbi:Branched-chain amino acid ATP-binding cassette transporter [Marinobacter mobilis]|uniref:Branched-chain amino acid ATP-binding cassette transporter n=1 Tax=Marinobacter mobilis TaxID=488533 RepID=A0A1H2WQQ9_9GAMM|nr:Branched-chain amino acid ATP-binding cassette transporter [Marinobacter mobilis]